MKKPLVSLIVPAYNAQQYLKETLDSLLSQTYAPLEIIIVDDGSTDNTSAIIASYNDKRIKSITQKNKGPSSARNRGIEKAKGSILGFVDSDDLLHSTAVSDAVACLSKNVQSSVCYSYFKVLDEGTLVKSTRNKTPQGNVYDLIRQHYFLGCGSNIFVKKNRCLTFDESMNIAEDWDFAIRLAKNDSFCCTKKFNVTYRKHSGALSTRFYAIQKWMHFFQKSYYRTNNSVRRKAKENVINYLQVYIEQKFAWHHPKRIISFLYLQYHRLFNNLF